MKPNILIEHQVNMTSFSKKVELKIHEYCNRSFRWDWNRTLPKWSI